MASWPEAVPQSPLEGSLDMQDDDIVLRSSFDAGTPMSRVRYTAASRRYAFDIIMSAAQLDALEDFYQDDCGRGATSFTMLDPYDGATLRTFHWASPIVKRPLVMRETWRVTVSLVREAL